MARIKLSLPQSFSFSTSIPIRITDLNYGNHVGNDTVLSLIHEARMQYLKSHGFTEMDLDGIGLIMGDVAIEFKTELFYGDVVTVFVAANDFSAVGFDLFYKLTKYNFDTVAALAKTGMVCYNYQQKKVARIPEEVKRKLMEETPL